MLTIITPVLNGSLYLENTILSIKKLNIPYEHIIVDGGSTDGTLEIINKYPDIILIHQKKKGGMYHAIDMGINIAKGNCISWVNSDDTIIAKGYEKMYYEISNKQLDLVFSDGFHHFIDKYKYKIIPALPFARSFLKQGVFPFVQTSSIFSKKAYFLVGGFDFINFKIIGDRDLFQKIAFNKSLKIRYVSIFSSVFLRYDDSLLYRNLDRVKIEHSFTIKTNKGILVRVLYHTFRFFKKIILNQKKNY